MDTQQIAEFVGNHPYLTGGFVAVLAFWLFTEIKRKTQGFKELTPAQAVALINGGNTAVIDVSPQADYSRGHIVDAMHVAPSQLDGSDQRLARLQDRSVLVVDKNGQIAGQSASRLLKQGFKDVSVLKGGMVQWVNDQFPVTKK